MGNYFMDLLIKISVNCNKCYKRVHTYLFIKKQNVYDDSIAGEEDILNDSESDNSDNSDDSYKLEELFNQSKNYKTFKKKEEDWGWHVYLK